VRRASLIYHPGGGSAEVAEIDQVRSLLSQSFDLETLLVDEHTDPGVLAQRALAGGSTLLIACGGDGTVSSVAAALVAHGSGQLGILPRGTANSIATHLGIPNNLQDACHVLSSGHERVVDTARVNDKPMVLMAALGVHADAITGVDPARKRQLGVLAYVLEELELMREDSLFEATLTVDGEQFTCEASAITVANLAPFSTLPAQGPDQIIDDDGKLDVTVIALRGFADAVFTSLHLAHHAFSRTPTDRDNIAFFRASEVRVETRKPRALMVDGEAAGETPLHVQSVPRSLRVLVPPTADA